MRPLFRVRLLAVLVLGQVALFGCQTQGSSKEGGSVPSAEATSPSATVIGRLEAHEGDTPVAIGGLFPEVEGAGQTRRTPTAAKDPHL